MGALGLTLIWNGVQELHTADTIGGYGVVVLQFIAGPLALYASYRLWRRQRRALKLIAVALTIATGAGALAAWTYTPGAERSAAAFGALGGGIVFTIAVVLLVRISLATASRPAELMEVRQGEPNEIESRS
jgi:hypothetical protein